MINTKSKTTFISLFIFVAIFSSACGKRKPPLPPIESISQKTEQLNGYQQGNQIILFWPAPQRNAPDGSIQSIRRIDVYRLAESPDSPLPLTEDEFSSRSTLIGSVNYNEILQPQTTIKYTDSLGQSSQPVRLRYAVRYVNSSGSRAAFSNFLLIEPTPNISKPPVITGKEETEVDIKLIWLATKENIDDSTPANLLGYNVYRITANQDTAKVTTATPLNSRPVTETFYSDSNFKFGEEYKYFVRAVSLGLDGNPVESLNSNNIIVAPKDIYPPSSPTSISIAASTGRLSIFFPSNPENDIAGYLIYRSADQNLPLKDWTKLTTDILTRTTFQDNNVESSKRYYYYIIAVDRSGNKSKPSEVISEVVP